MIRFLLRRLAESAVVIFVIFLISFVIMRLAPGSPFDADKEQPAVVVANQAAVTGMATAVPAGHAGVVDQILVQKNQELAAGAPYAVLRLADGSSQTLVATSDLRVFRCVRAPGEAIGAEEPILYAATGVWTQLGRTLWSYAHLDFGTTFKSQGTRTVLENIKETLPISVELGAMALLLALLIGVPIGLLAGLRQNSWLDHGSMSVAMLGISLPTIVLGPLLIVVFIMKLEWLPPHGGWEPGLWNGTTQKILPVLTLALVYAAYFARLTRGGMLEVVNQDWIRMARAKGLPERTVVFRHAFRGAILPAVSFLGPAMAGLLVGSVVVERVYKIPGISKYFVESALERDYPMVMGVVIVYSVFLVLFNLLVDIAYAYLDPRVTHE